MFVAIADRKPCVLKLNSFAEHNARPLITGTKERFTYKPVCSPTQIIGTYMKHWQSKKHRDHSCSQIQLGHSPRTILEIRTVKMGAELLIVSVKLTAIYFKETSPKTTVTNLQKKINLN